MAFEVVSRYLGEVVVLVGKTFQDNRGLFTETYRQDQFEAAWAARDFCTGQPLVFEEGRNPRLAFSVGSAYGQIDASHAWFRFFGGCGFATGITHIGQMGWCRGVGGEQEASLGSRKFCAWILRADGRGRGSIQVHGDIQLES